MFPSNLPVFISVDSPDHSDADADSTQDQRPQGQLPVFNREAIKFKYRKSI